MAKKSRIHRLIDTHVQNGYDNGFWHSLIIHTLFLTIMAFIVDTNHCQPLKPIIINFSSSETEILELESPAIDISNAEIFTTDVSNKYHKIVDDPNINIVVESPQLEQHFRYSIDLKQIDYKDLNDRIMPNNNNELLDNTIPIKINSSNQSNRFDERLSQPKADMLKELIAGGTKLADGVPHAIQNNMTEDGDISQRLQSYGAKTGDIQVSLAWNTVDDIDLHVIYANAVGNERIYFLNRTGYFGGILDIDMNANGSLSNTPIENIFWPHKQAPAGQYTVLVHFFRSWSNNKVVPVTIRIKTLKGVVSYNASVKLGDDPIIVANFSN